MASTFQRHCSHTPASIKLFDNDVQLPKKKFTLPKKNRNRRIPVFSGERPDLARRICRSLSEVKRLIGITEYQVELARNVRQLQTIITSEFYTVVPKR